MLRILSTPINNPNLGATTIRLDNDRKAGGVRELLKLVLRVGMIHTGDAALLLNTNREKVRRWADILKKKKMLGKFGIVEMIGISILIII